MEKISPTFSGLAGEYFVAAELSRRGIIASVTLKNTKGVDVLASDTNVKQLVGIQVKTNQNAKRKWLLNEQAEKVHSDNFFYVFVNLDNKKSCVPDYFIVPSKIVAKRIKENHKRFIENKGNDTAMREFIIEDLEKSEYKNNWNILGLSTTKKL
jgi:hypothetical protein